LDSATRVVKVRYYTAPIKRSASDDPASPGRQQKYLRALKAYLDDSIEIVQGSIVRTTPIARLLNALSRRLRFQSQGGAAHGKGNRCQSGGGLDLRHVAWTLRASSNLQ
jgi:hypothetical protein